MTNCIVDIADFKEISEIHCQIPEFGHENADFFSKRCNDKAFLALKCKVDGNPAGYAVSYDRYDDNSLYIWMVASLPAYRKRGVFSALARETEAWAKKNGYNALKIKTRNNRREMLHWLVKNDFQFMEVDIRDPVHENRIQLIKSL